MALRATGDMLAGLSVVLLGRERLETTARWRGFSDEALSGNGALAYKWLRAEQASVAVEVVTVDGEASTRPDRVLESYRRAMETTGGGRGDPDRGGHTRSCEPLRGAVPRVPEGT